MYSYTQTSTSNIHTFTNSIYKLMEEKNQQSLTPIDFLLNNIVEGDTFIESKFAWIEQWLHFIFQQQTNH